MNKFSNGLRKLLLFTVCSVCFFACDHTRPIKTCETFVESADPTSDTLSDWSNISPGLNASFVSIDIKYPKSVAPEVAKSTSCDLVGWKNEKLSAQLLLWSAEDISQIEFEFSDFKSEKGKLPAGIAQARFVRYVIADSLFMQEYACAPSNPDNIPQKLVPDMIDSLSCFDIKAKTVRPVWITVNIPANAEASKYKGKLVMYARAQQKQEFEIELEVQDHTLTNGVDRPFHLDMWQHPSAVARVENLEIWSDAHFKALDKYMKPLADAGQKVITANINKDPWNHQCYDAYEDMIVWTKKADGSWVYDYTVFDKWVNYMMGLGVKEMINCYSLLPWNYELHYKDEAKGETITVKADPKTKVFEQMWAPFLADFDKHLKEKGWDKITNIAMDERSPEEMKVVISVLEKNAPDISVAFADNHKSYRRFPYIKDFCTALDAPIDTADINMRRAKGLTTTFYVCCAHQFPNTFTFSNSYDATYMAWYAYAAGYDGMLRWSYNSWVEKPEMDSRFRTWPSGDTYVVYPGLRSSIRWERMTEGLQDIEKIRLLREDLIKANTDKAKADLAKLDSEVIKFSTYEPVESADVMLDRAKILINELSR